jgi:Regulator of chromosome condensation (RCC1) repeat
MKTKLPSAFSLLHSSFAILAALAWCLTALPARAQNNNVTISAADFQRMVYSAHLYSELTLKPELGACLRTLLEMQRRNPNADPMALADVSRQALQYYRTNEPFYIRTNGYPDEVLSAYLDALRHIPAHTNFVPANLTMLNYFMLNASDYYYFTNSPTSVFDLINSGGQRLFSTEGEVANRQSLVDDCVARARDNSAFAAAMDSLLLPETGVSLQDTPAEIIGNTNSPLHDDDTMTNLLALSEASGNGSLTVSSNQLMTLFSGEMQTVQDTINTNLAVLAQINESHPDYLSYVTNQAAIDANVQLQAAVQQGQPARLASASAAVLLQSKLLPVNEQSAQMEGAVSSAVELGTGIAELCIGDPAGMESAVSGGLDIFNLFNGGQSAQDAMVNSISNLQTTIGDLNHNVNYRFDRVDESLTTIFNTMNQQFNNIQILLIGQNQQIAQLSGNVYDIRSSLVTVQSSLDRIEAENANDFSSELEDTIKDPIDNDLLYRVQYPPTRGPLPEVGYGSSGGGYEADEGLFYNFAVDKANDSTVSPYSSLDFSPSGLQQQLTGPLDHNLNYIQQFLKSTLNVSTVGKPGDPAYLANPQEWFIAAYAYLQLAGENPMYFRKDASPQRVSSIIGQGQSIADFCSDLTFNPGTTNINWILWNALESYCFDGLTNFNGQILAAEAAYANSSRFNVATWRQWDAAAPHVTAATTAVLSAPEDPNIPADLTNAAAIAAGNFFGLALRADGTIIGWGDNSYGESTASTGVTNVVAISTGYSDSLALKADGTVVGWGDDSYGQTNIPSGLTNVVAIAAGWFHGLALRADGTVAGWGGLGNNDYGQGTVPPGLTNVVAIAAGGLHSLALKADGTVVGWGDDSSSQTSVPAGVTNVVAIAAGGYHSLALKADGTVVGWGNPSENQISIPHGLTNVVAIAAGKYFSLALKADGTVVAWGQNTSGQTITLPAGLTNVVAIAALGNQSYFLTVTNTGGSAASGGLSFVRAEIPERLGSLFQDWNQNTIDELGRSGSGLDNAAVQLTGAKMLLTDVLELGMPYTLAHDGILHGFLYGSESLADTSAATNFLQTQNVELQASPKLAPPQLTVEGALRYAAFQNRLNQDLTNLQATGQPEIPRLVGQTLRLLNLLSDSWTSPTNSPPPALEISSQSNAPSLLLYGEPYMNYTLQYQDSLGAPGWTTTTFTNLQDGQTIIPPLSGAGQRFYRLMLPTP